MSSPGAGASLTGAAPRAAVQGRGGEHLGRVLCQKGTCGRGGPLPRAVKLLGLLHVPEKIRSRGCPSVSWGSG